MALEIALRRFAPARLPNKNIIGVRQRANSLCVIESVSIPWTAELSACLMFDYIKIQGFRSFRKVELNLEPLCEVRVELLLKRALDGSRVTAQSAGEKLDVRFVVTLRDFGAGAAQDRPAVEG